MIAVSVCYTEGNSSTLCNWESSLMCRPSSVSSVAVHLSVLESCVAWSRSALRAYCRICRRRGNGELMLLCDGCDRGHHTYCLKPPMKVRRTWLVMPFQNVVIKGEYRVRQCTILCFLDVFIHLAQHCSMVVSRGRSVKTETVTVENGPGKSFYV